MKNTNLYLRRNYHTLKGWTFIETLIVIGIILILTSTVGFMSYKYIDQAKQAGARSQVDILVQAINAYYLDTKKFPTEDEGLSALTTDIGTDDWNGPYLSKAVGTDPWGNSYLYKNPGSNGLPFEILSLGADGTPGGEGPDKDISSAY